MITIVRELTIMGRTWRLRRYEYDGAPLEAYRVPFSQYDDEYSAEIDKDGDLMFDSVPDGCRSPYLPGEVLIELVKDGIARGVLPSLTATPGAARGDGPTGDAALGAGKAGDRG